MPLAIDIICPVFREEQSIELFHDRLQAVLDRLRIRYKIRIRYVVDPSHDRSEAILESISRRDRDVEVLVMSRRFGHQAALIAGIDHSRADAIIMLDSDLQHPPELIPQMIEHWENGAEIVQMVRQDGQESGFFRRLTSRWFYRLLLKIGTVELPPGAADYRLISKRVAEVFRARLLEQNPFVRGLVSWVGFKPVYVPFVPARRERGKSNYSSSALFALAVNGISSFSRTPLRISTAVGLCVAILSLLGGVLQVALYMFSSAKVPGWPSLIVLISFMAGLQLFFMGILGEYIGSIFDEVKSRPRYLLARHIEGGKSIGEKVGPSETEVPLPSRKEFEWSGTSAMLEAVVTRRGASLFAKDLQSRRDTIKAALAGKRVMIVGGGGSIGSATTEMVLGYAPAAVHIVDQSENYLAEVVRDLRGRYGLLRGIDLRALPLDYGGPAMARLLREEKPYHAVLNFAAIKHVRSEKDVYSVLQMLDTNVVRHIRFRSWLADYGHASTYFAVSTDKAANPVSLMGASKRLMEDLIFAYGANSGASTTAARFANVAFSNGSLLESLPRRVARGQPVAVPKETRRYFISHREAAEICLLAATSIPHRHIAIPKLDARSELQALDEIAARVLSSLGYEPVLYEDETEARSAVSDLARQGKWPLLLTPLDTSGEKSYEEFVGQGEVARECGLENMLAIQHVPTPAYERGLFDRLIQLVQQPPASTSKAEIVEIIGAALANFHHVDTGRHLDQRL